MTEIESTELVTIATFTSGVEAAIAQQSLRAAGIDAYIHDGAMATAMWHLGVALGGVKLQVSSLNAKEACRIIEEARAHDRSSEVPIGDELDDQSDELEITTTEHSEAVHRALKASIFGMLFPPLTLYAGWLLLKLWQSGESLNSKNRRHVCVAALLMIAASCWYLFCLAMFIGFDEPSFVDG